VTELPGLVGGGHLGDIQYLRPLDAPDLFRRRAERFRAQAPGHPMGDALELFGRVAEAQAAALDRLRVSPNGRDLPATLPLDASRPPGGEWLQALRLVTGELERAPMPEAARQALTRLGRLGETELDRLGAQIARGDLAGVDVAAAPFVAAGLQAHYSALAALIPPEVVERSPSGCPLCGSPPVAGLILGDDKLRYLACSLCGSQWHHTRLKCSHCDTTQGISYFSIEGDAGEVKAEACDACKGYVKLLYLEKRPAADPVADDLATLPLDLLVSERGFGRIGPNLFLLPGAE
jgi:FdhE protein